MFSRHPSPDLRTRDILPCDEIKIGNKHHANAKVCAFYAKGWCIKGDSCSFVHIKDPENKSGQQTEGEPITQNRKRELQPEEGTSYTCIVRLFWNLLFKHLSYEYIVL